MNKVQVKEAASLIKALDGMKKAEKSLLSDAGFSMEILVGPVNWEEGCIDSPDVSRLIVPNAPATFAVQTAIKEINDWLQSLGCED